MSNLILTDIRANKYNKEEFSAHLLSRYANEPDIKALADKINSTSLGCPPVCETCILAAILKLNKPYEQTKS